MRLAFLIITVLPLSAPALAQEAPTEQPVKRLVFEESPDDRIIGVVVNPINLVVKRQEIEVVVEPTFEVDLIKEIARAVERAPF